jgi:dienelactone hydrolase
MTEDTRDATSDAHGGPECHVIVVETNDPHMTTVEMANAVLDALHDAGNHDVIHVGVVGRTTRRSA